MAKMGSPVIPEWPGARPRWSVSDLGSGAARQSGKPGIAWRLYPNSYLVLHTHMQPSGKNELVKFHMGIRFTDERQSNIH